MPQPAAITRSTHSSSSGSSTPTVRVSSPLNPSSSSSTPTSQPRPLNHDDDTDNNHDTIHTRKPPSEPSLSPPGTPSLGTGRGRKRGSSVTSTIRPSSPSHCLVHSLSRVASSPPASTSTSSTQDQDHPTIRGRTTSLGHPTPSSRSNSTSRTTPTTRRIQGGGRSDRSLSPFRDLTWRVSGGDSPGRRTRDQEGNETPPNGEPVSWWNSSKPVASRPWCEKKQKTVPQEQIDGWVRTREKVAQATKGVLGAALNVTHEALAVSADLLQLAPVPGLAEAARTLLTIWDALQMVDMNRLACLRLTERCATILISVREEIADAGDQVGEELKEPIVRLVEAFKKVHRLLIKEIHRPFLKRYLRRDEIQVKIHNCDTALSDALGMFSLSIQVRLLKQVFEADKKREAILDHLVHDHDHTYEGVYTTPIEIGAEGEEGERMVAVPRHQQALLERIQIGEGVAGLPPIDQSSSSSPSLLESSSSPAGGGKETPLQALNRIQAKQNKRDQSLDTADLRRLMRNALMTSSDAEMIRVLQVSRDEMPEAIKTLQRALEKVVEREGREGDERQEDGGSDIQEVVEVEEEIGSGGNGIGKGKGNWKVGKGKGRGTGKDNSGGGQQEGEKTMIVVRSGTDQSTASAATTATRTTTHTTASSAKSRKSSSGTSRDTLDREFIESGIDSLVRLSRTLLPQSASSTDSTSLDPLSLPSWTITRYEVDREEKIGIGFFSDVYKGRYLNNNREVVAIKVLAESTPRKLFVREVEIWKGLKHENVLELLGASSTAGDPPWFLVSRYCENGNLVEFLKRGGARETGGMGGSSRVGRGVVRKDGTLDLLRIVHEVARGMAYLHSKKVLHGDLKGTNILIDDKLHCVISDFGQSQIKSEVYRISGKAHPHGTLRWQAPELMTGQSDLTPAMDVYAFAICCVEILTNGALPWPHSDDDAVRHFVLKEHTRPDLPLNRVWSTQLAEVVNACWKQDPELRPPFMKIDADVQVLRSRFERGEEESNHSPNPPSALLSHIELPASRKSPDMHPVPLPILPPDTTATVVDPLEDSPSLTDGSFETAHGGLTPDPTDPKIFHIETDTNADPGNPDSPVQEHHTTGTSSTTRISRTSTLSIITSPSGSMEGGGGEDERSWAYYSGWESPVPADDRVAAVKNERRYRMLLQHEFHPSLILPLWTPCRIFLGAVGYHRKPEGDFVTLFNAMKPHESSRGLFSIPSLYGYGRVSTGSQKVEKRNLAQKAMDIIQSWLRSRAKSGGTLHVGRKYSTPLRNGHKAAHLFTESTVYRYVEDLVAPKAWFKANIEHILKMYGRSHSLQKEDILLVIGTLETSDYALHMSHNHPDGQLDFNVFTSPQTGRPWGQFSTSSTTDAASWLGSGINGPVYVEDPPGSVSASKVSKVEKTRGWNSVLLARLRFPTDKADPTSL